MIEKIAYYDWCPAIEAVLHKIQTPKTEAYEIIRNLSEVVNGIFCKTVATSLCYQVKELPFPLYIDETKRRVFAVCKPPLPTIRKNGGWKNGYSSLMFEGTEKKITLVWGLIDKVPDIIGCIEHELTEAYKDKPFWPEVQFYHKETVTCGEKIQTKRYLFSDYYNCDFETACNMFKLTDRDIITLVKHVAEAIAFIHKIGLIHGDIKSSNILIGRRAVLCDFDLSFYQNTNKPAFEMYATPCYSSPELVSPLRKGFLADYKPSDMYALGVSLQGMKFWTHPSFWPNKIQRYMFSSIRNPLLRQQAHFQQQAMYERSHESLSSFRKEKPTADKVYMIIKNVLLHPDMYKRPSADELISYINKAEVTESVHLFDSISQHPKP